MIGYHQLFTPALAAYPQPAAAFDTVCRERDWQNSVRKIDTFPHALVAMA